MEAILHEQAGRALRRASAVAHYRFDNSTGARIFRNRCACTQGGEQDGSVVRWVDVILSLSWGEPTAFLASPGMVASSGEARPRSTVAQPTRALILTFVFASVVSRNEVLCVRMQLAKVYFDTQHGKSLNGF